MQNVSTSRGKKRHILMALSLSTAILATSAYSQTNAKERNAPMEGWLGAGAGLVVGALAGGPFGAVLGAWGGAETGERIHQAKRTEEALTALQAQQQLTQTELASAKVQLAQQQDLLSGLSLDIGFRTASAAIPKTMYSSLEQLSQVLQAHPSLHVMVDGYADPRGKADYNTRLSAQRAESVGHYLQQAGISAERIKTAGHGDKHALVNLSDPDALALERRATVTLIDPNQSLVVSN